jgi:hypothetical protein
MILECPGCAVKCRIPSLPKSRLRCGKCQRIFTPAELTKATLEPPPPKVTLGDLLEDDEVEEL